MFKDLIPWRRPQTGQPTRGELVPSGSSDIGRLRDEFDSLLDRVWNPVKMWEDFDDIGSGWGCDVEDGDHEIVVRAEAPGFQPEEIDVQLSGNRIVLKAEHREESNEHGGLRKHSRFYRSMTVPPGIESDGIEAEYKNGVLKVHLPKGPEARAKRISVKAK